MLFPVQLCHALPFAIVLAMDELQVQCVWSFTQASPDFASIAIAVRDHIGCELDLPFPGMDGMLLCDVDIKLLLLISFITGMALNSLEKSLVILLYPVCTLIIIQLSCMLT